MAERQPRTVAPPASGVWRIARGQDPLAWPPPSTPESPRTGNRFDSPDATFSVLYFGTTLQACFGETLARFRPTPALADLVRDEWDDMGVMAAGQLAADWRHRRSAVRADMPADARFLDVDNGRTLDALRDDLLPALVTFGFKDLDLGMVRGPDRRVTRLLAAWAYQALNTDGVHRFAGIRYRSRLDNGWECWAVFDRTPVRALQLKAIAVDDPDLKAITRRWGIRAH